MSREKPNFRELVSILYDIFGKRNITCKEYADYLDKTPERVSDLIKKGVLPGRAEGRDFIIPISSIALYEINSQGK